MFTFSFPEEFFNLNGVEALDFSERMGLGSYQSLFLAQAHIELEVPNWFVRAHAQTGQLHAYLDPTWLLRGEVKLEGDTNRVRFTDFQPERAAQLFITALHSVQARRIEELETAVREAISELEATRDQFQSSAIAGTRRKLEDVLQPTPAER